MGMPADFVDPITGCMNGSMTWPGIAQPGLPNFCVGLLAANMAGINFLLDFIPPTPEKIAGLTIPSITLFQDAFMASINLGDLQDPTAALKFIELGFTLPFRIVSTMITDLLNLTVTLPTIPGVEAIIGSLSVSLGIPTAPVATFAGCAPPAVVGLFTSSIPA
jgi:hypothetical protein